ncbi:MAG: hypothetical protein ACRYFX_04595 [Janthinobacterium lividum]
MEAEIIELPGFDAAYVPALSLVASITKDMPRAPAAPAVKVTGDVAEAGKFAKWGTDNKLPFTLLDAVNANAVLKQAIYWKSNAVISGGLAYGNIVIDPTTGRESLQRVIDPLVESFLRKSNVLRYLREASLEFYKFWNVWPELVLSNDRKSIASISCHESAHCRWGLQNAKGLIDTCYINAQWDNGGKWDAPETVTLPVIDVYYDPVTTVRSQPTLASFIYPIAGTSSGKTYYQDAPWHALPDQGWLDVANSIAKYKKAILKNSMHVKYQLEIHEWWFQAKYKDWDEKPALKAQRMQTELSTFNTKMKGEDGAGNSLINMKKTLDGKEYSGWSITAIPDLMKDEKYLGDSQEADSHIFFALGLDATLIGTVPGKGMGAGSGSDKRVAMNIATANAKAEQDILLEPLNFIFEYNGFVNPATGLPYTIWFKNYWVTTLDTGKETSAKPTPQ